MIKPILKPQKIKKVKKRKQKTERQKMVLKLDKLFSLVIRTRDQFRCQKDNCTGKGIHMQCAHIFSRSRFSVRWDLDNAITFCYYHHILWSHRKGVEFTLWCQEFLGIEKFKRLQKKANDARPFTMEMMKEKEIELTNKLKEYQDKLINKVF
jgi:hypothetical protein